MNPNRFFTTAFCISLMALTQCNKSETTRNGSTDAAADSTTAKGQGVKNSIPIIKDGLSPAFTVVTSKLDVGGSSLTYNEATGMASWASMLDGFIKMAPEADRKALPPGFSFAQIFDALGLNSVVALGSSSRQRADGSYHSRAVSYMPQGRKGLLTLTGGPATRLLLLEVAPKDTDFALEFSLNLKDFTRDTLPRLLAMTPPQEQAKATAGLNEAIPGLGITIKQALEKLDIRMGLFLRMDPTQKIPLDSSSPPLPGADGVLVVEHLGWLIEALKPQFMPMLQSPQAPVSMTDEGGVITLRSKTPVGRPPMDYQPVLRYDPKADRILLASRPALFDAAMAGTDKFTQRADFADTWRDLPQEGNDCLFISKRFLQAVGDYANDAAKKRSGGAAAANAVVVEQLTKWVQPMLNRNQVLVLANQPDGIFTATNSGIAFNPSTLATLSTLSILSSLAVPTFAKVQAKGTEVHEINNAKQVTAALIRYTAEHGGKYPEKLSELTLPDPGILQCVDPATKLPVPWIYAARNEAAGSATAQLLLVSPPHPDGKRIGAFSDGSARLITEAEYALSKAKW